MSKRIKWVDTTKFLGIFAIYLGHFGPSIGKSFELVYAYHVALFFFLSGCMSTYDHENNIFKFIKKKFKKIMIPFFIFSFISLIFYILLEDPSLQQVLQQVKIVIRGNIRNEFFAESLWFLSCLFLMEVIFKVLKKINNKLIIFLICLAIFLIFNTLIKPTPLESPKLLYNLDTAFFYLIFYAIGYITYPKIIDLFELNTKSKKIIFITLGIIFSIYASVEFFKHDSLFNFLSTTPIIKNITPILRALPLIGLNIIVARLLDKITLFNEIGRETLFLCGNEFLIKSMAEALITFVGLNCNLSYALQVYLYTMILLIIGIKLIIPFEKKLGNSILYEFKK